MKSTYIGKLNDEVNDVKTLVSAMDEEDAKVLVLKKFRGEFDLDFCDDDVEVFPFPF